MRINKFISETGICSRREVDKLIEDKRVMINGRLAGLGDQVEEGDEVKVDGRILRLKRKNIYIVLNKPVGITCTTERHIKGNIIDFVNHEERIFPIGRLDKDSDGLILLTSDGDIVNRILRAENNHEKEYIVTVDKPITKDFIRGMSGGVRIEDYVTKRCRVTPVSEKVFKIILTEGHNRQIRKMCKAFGYGVARLQRIRIMNIKLGSLKMGHWRNLTSSELTELFNTLSYKPKEL